jgi:hypothetical protein
MNRACSRYFEKISLYRMGELEGKRSLGKPRRRLENNMMEAREMDGALQTGLIWLNIGTSGGLL